MYIHAPQQPPPLPPIPFSKPQGAGYNSITPHVTSQMLRQPCGDIIKCRVRARSVRRAKPQISGANDTTQQKNNSTIGSYDRTK